MGYFMKVKELIKALKKFDPELEVLTSKDSEGNGYNRTDFYLSQGHCSELNSGYIENITYEEDIEDLNEVNCVVI